MNFEFSGVPVSEGLIGSPLGLTLMTWLDRFGVRTTV